MSVGWAALTVTRRRTVVGCKGICGSTAFAMQQEIKGRQTSKHSRHHIWSAAQQGSGVQGLSIMYRPEHHSTGSLKKKKEQKRKEKANIPHVGVGNDLGSTRQTSALFRGQSSGDCWEAGWSTYGSFRALGWHLEQKLETWTLSQWNWVGTVLRDVFTDLLH